MEKLHEKMAQRINELKNILTNQSLLQSVKPHQRVISNPSRSPTNTIAVPSIQNSSKLNSDVKMFDNPQIKQSNVSFKQFHFVNNFYEKSPNSYSLTRNTSKCIKQLSPLNARKMYSNLKKSTLTSKLSSWVPNIIQQQNVSNTISIDKNAMYK